MHVLSYRRAQNYSTLFSSSVNNHLLILMLSRTNAASEAMVFDFIILSFTAAALHRKHTARTDLWKLLFHDGLVYFLISFTMNCIPAVGLSTLYRRKLTKQLIQVLNVLNLNSEPISLHFAVFLIFVDL